MAGALFNMLRLVRAGLVLAEYGVRLLPPGVPVPLALRLANAVMVPWRGLTWPFRALLLPQAREARMAAALTRLGPSYIKLGQFLATRGDLIGGALAKDLATLQDRMAPFPMAEARAAIETALGQPVNALFAALGPPVAAASIAQVHKATVRSANGAIVGSANGAEVRNDDGAACTVAVKVLRPGIERRFAADLESYRFAARQIERFQPRARRLRPIAVVDMLARSVEIEMDLRLEAAAISEMAENVRAAGDEGFRVPEVDWQRTARRVLTLEWIDGTPIADREALVAAGHDTRALGTRLLQVFLKHAMHDGFFHADMHPGNLFVDRQGTIVAVDFGIMGRLGPKEQRFLAEILFGFITRDYMRAAAVHFDAGYVPQDQSVELFAQALRAIGEPLHGRIAEDISMGHLLGQLFQYTEVFDMATRPELILLQKTMVVVEGVARMLDPGLDMWTACEPVVREWMEKRLGSEGRLRDVRKGADQVGKILGDLPGLLARAEQALFALSGMARDGIRLDQATVEKLAAEDARGSRSGRIALWVGALALVALVLLVAARLF